jgi:4a-hydroxytetrahydrobiopterin dehydratase
MPSDREALTVEEINRGLKALPNWTFEDKALVFVKTFPTYLTALEFVGKVGQASEERDHHPDIIMNYKKVTVKYWTHSADGVTRLDFKMARRVDRIAAKI